MLFALMLFGNSPKTTIVAAVYKIYLFINKNCYDYVNKNRGNSHTEVSNSRKWKFGPIQQNISLCCNLIGWNFKSNWIHYDENACQILSELLL